MGRPPSRPTFWLKLVPGILDG
eukprot:COSAG01_NODE_13650_length_1553_cov_2.889959_1_plen_21_part_10